jgi:PleD family two-component response regulator
MKATVPRGFNLGADDYVVKPARGSVAVSHAVIAEGDVMCFSGQSTQQVGSG